MANQPEPFENSDTYYWLTHNGYGGQNAEKTGQELSSYNAKYGRLADSLMSSVRTAIPEASSAYRELIIAGMYKAGPPPADAASKKAWIRSVIMNANNLRQYVERDAYQAYAAKKGWDPNNLTQEQMNEAMSTSTHKWEGGNKDQFQDEKFLQAISATTEEEMNKDPSLGAGVETTDENEYKKKLQQFKDALYNQGTANRLGDMAAGQAERAAYSAGVRGGAAQQGIGANVADAALKYNNDVNAQALQFMGVENQANVTNEQAREFNMRSAMEMGDRATQKGAQLGGTIGAIGGGVLGGIASYYTGNPMFIGMGTSLGSGVGSAIGGATANTGGGSLGSLGRGARGGATGV